MKKRECRGKFNFFGKIVELDYLEITYEPGDVQFYGCFARGVMCGTMVPGDEMAEAELCRMMDAGFTIQQFCDATGRKLGFDKGGDTLLSKAFRDPRELNPIIVDG